MWRSTDTTWLSFNPDNPTGALLGKRWLSILTRMHACSSPWPSTDGHSIQSHLAEWVGIILDRQWAQIELMWLLRGFSWKFILKTTKIQLFIQWNFYSCADPFNEFFLAFFALLFLPSPPISLHVTLADTWWDLTGFWVDANIFIIYWSTILLVFLSSMGNAQNSKKDRDVSGWSREKNYYFFLTSCCKQQHIS